MSAKDRDWYYEHYDRQNAKENERSGIIALAATIIMPFLLCMAFAFRSIVPYISTGLIVSVNVVVFVLFRLGVIRTGDVSLSYRKVYRKRQYYRLVTSAFSQDMPLHLLMNMCSLISLGYVLEPMLGSAKFMTAYLIIMLVSGLVSSGLRKNDLFMQSIGSSGAICGLFGIYMVFVFNQGSIMAIGNLVPTLLILVMMTASPQIDSRAHFSGLITGALMAAAYLYI